MAWHVKFRSFCSGRNDCHGRSSVTYCYDYDYYFYNSHFCYYYYSC